MCSKINKDINVKAFNMIKNKDEAKARTEHISCDSKCKFSSTTCNSEQKWNNKTCQYECKNYHRCEKDYSWNSSTYICENSNYLRSIADNILILLIYNISYKALIDSKPLRTRFFKIDKFIRIYNGTRYLTLFGSEKYDAIYNRIRYLISIKSGITYIFSHYFGNKLILMILFLPIEKRWTLHNVIIHIKPVLNKDKNHYYYKVLLCSYDATMLVSIS